MPIHTPSPHRFLVPAPPSTQKKTKPQSSLRHGLSTPAQARTPKPKLANAFRATDVVAGEGKKVTPAKRFVLGNTDRRRERGEEVALEGRNTKGVGTPQRLASPRLGRVESIDESSPSSSLATTDGRAVVQSVEHASRLRKHHEQENNDDEEEEEDDEIFFVTEELYKRRRISPELRSSPPSIQHPQQTTPQQPPLQHHPHNQNHNQETPAPKPASNSHRFKLPAPKTPSVFDNTSNSTTTPTTSTATTSRPHFILPHPSPSPTKSLTPLPETFSPSRKSGKYVPGGLASTLQSWIIETADTGYTARHSANSGSDDVIWGTRDREDGVKMRVRVCGVMSSRQGNGKGGREVEAWSNGVVFVTGMVDKGGCNALGASSTAFGAGDGGGGVGVGREEVEVRVVLAGQGGSRGKGRGGVKIGVGTVVGIRAPMWDVDLVGGDDGGGRWIVGVEWVVCS
ncbi:hypothetical protein CC80DRAFT_528845 [Byssothecium circinans]|uniref:Uncharacterized protein n=1 Tax=Byssothecium circinans TaxID=147558 RepID=A0A6A5TE98_9PLEO|nr:hypothetical protein CC80DRAFT_528845 [Byssothecium circinans]